MDYASFLANKAIVDPPTGIDTDAWIPHQAFPHQRDIARWLCRRGRGALFAGTGLGKSLMSLTWADNVVRETGKPALYFNPLAVSAQMVNEATKFGICARQVAAQADVAAGINVTNYHKLPHFDMAAFGGVVLGEGSILKNQTGHYRTALIEACRNVPFRMIETATPAPNDYMELGNHAEFLGVMSYTDMLATFFVHDGGETQKWRLKGHAENAFWEWMASWAVMLRKPSDLGYSDAGYELPPLSYHMHTLSVEHDPAAMGTLFATTASTLSDRLTARRASVEERVALAASITPDDRPFVWWCHLNAESEQLAKAIPGAVETKGTDGDDVQERKIADFLAGRVRVLVSKPSVTGYGLNMQHCADTGFIGLNDSWEQFYQAVRRFWRFGQQKPVNCHIIATEVDGATVGNIKRKEADADRMATAMVMHMRDLNAVAVRGATRTRDGYNPEQPVRLPAWLGEAA